MAATSTKRGGRAAKASKKTTARPVTQANGTSTNGQQGERMVRARAGTGEARIVRRYLNALDGATPTPGTRRKPPERLHQMISELSDQIAAAKGDPVTRLQLIQRRIDLQNELSMTVEADDLPAAEQEFIRIASRYAERKGISYTAFRSVGVPAQVLRQAGIRRTN